MKYIKGICLFLFTGIFFSCKYFNRDLPAYLEYYTSEACIANHEIISQYVAKDSQFNKCGIDCVKDLCEVKFFLRNPQGYDLHAVTENTYLLPSYFTQSSDKRFLYYSNTLDEDISLTDSIGLKALMPNSSDFRSMQETYSFSVACDTQPPLIDCLAICFKDNGDSTRDYYLCFNDSAYGDNAFENVDELYINSACYNYKSLPSDRFFNAVSDLYLFYDNDKEQPYNSNAAHPMYYLIESNVNDGSGFSYTAYLHYEDSFLKGETSSVSMASSILSDITWSTEGGSNLASCKSISDEDSSGLHYITLSQCENAVIYVTVKDSDGNTVGSLKGTGSVKVFLDKGKYSVCAYAKKPGYIDTAPLEYFYKVNTASYVKSDGEDSLSRGGKTNPYKTLSYALSQIESDSSDDVLIYVLDDLENLTESIEIVSLPGTGDIYIEGFQEKKNIFMTESSGIDRHCFYVLGRKVHLKNLNLKGFALSDSSSKGGCIYAENAEVFLEGCTLKDSQSAYYGGAVYVNKDAFVSLKDCEIENCSATSVGGGICSYGSVTLENCEIKGCSADWGGGLYSNATNSVLNEGKVTITECTFGNSVSACPSESTASFKSLNEGGALYLCGSTNKTAVIKDSVIQNGYSKKGGGIYVSDIKLEMKNTSVKYCASDDAGTGGGVFINNTSCLMEGTSCIEECRSGKGGGVYLEKSSILDIKDSAKVIPSSDNSCDVYFAPQNGSYPIINISGSLTSSEKKAYIKTDSDVYASYKTSHKAVSITDGVSLSATYIVYFEVALNGSDSYVINADGYFTDSSKVMLIGCDTDMKLELVKALRVILDSLSEANKWVTDVKNGTPHEINCADIDSVVDEIEKNKGIVQMPNAYYIVGDNAKRLTAGSSAVGGRLNPVSDIKNIENLLSGTTVYLDGEFSITEPLSIPKGVNIQRCPGAEKAVIKASSAINATSSVSDKDEQGMLNIFSGSNIFKGITIDGANQASCIVAKGTSLTLTDCVIQNGYADNSYNKDNSGGGIYASCSLYLKGSTSIKNCTATGRGGGIMISGVNTVYMSDDVCIENCSSVSNKGNGICLYAGSTLDIKDNARIIPGSNNSCDVYVVTAGPNSSKINVSGTLTSDLTALLNGDIKFTPESCSNLSSGKKLSDFFIVPNGKTLNDDGTVQ